MPVGCELADYPSVVAASAIIKEAAQGIDMVIANAGLNVPSLEHVEGVEKHFAVQHLAHVLLVEHLLDRVVAADGRVVLVSSGMHRDAPPEGILFDDLGWKGRPYSWVQAYGQSKLANIAFARDLARRLEATGASASSLHPGSIRGTNIAAPLGKRPPTPRERVTGYPSWLLYRLRHGGFHFKDIPQGAATNVFVAAHPAAADAAGKYFVDCAPSRTHHRALADPTLDQRLREVSHDLLAGYLPA